MTAKSKEQKDPLLTYAWYKPRGGRRVNTSGPKCSWRKNDTLAIDFPITLLREAGIEPGTWVSFMLTEDDPKAVRIEAGGTLKVRTDIRRPDYPCAFINVKFPIGDLMLTGSHGMAALEGIIVDGSAIAFRLPGDLAFAPAKAE
jgi:hypothetical protein